MSERPSPYQLNVLRSNGCRIRPRDYESARRRISGLAPSENQVKLLNEIGLLVPDTRAAASAAITAYEEAHPEWARARRAQRTAKGQATRLERQRAGVTPEYNEVLRRFHEAAITRFGPTAASPAALSYLRALALQLPKDSPERIAAFRAMAEGLSAAEAGRRIDALKPPPAT